MGLDQKVAVASERLPPWPRLRDLLAARGMAVQLRMIDEQLAFPDEEPGEGWADLRVGAPGGMVTLRRESDGIRFVIWGNADAALMRSWNTLTWAVAELSGGMVETNGTRLSAQEFARAVGLLVDDVG